MSSHTSIVIFSTDSQAPSKLASLLAMCRSSVARMWAHFSGPQRNWLWSKQLWAGEDYDCGEIDAQSVGPTPIADIPALFRPPGMLLVTFVDSPWGPRVTNAMLESIPLEVRGVLADELVDVAVRCGEDEHCNAYDPGTAEYYGTAYLSLSFNAYTTPPDFIGFRDRVLALPAILEIKREFERVVGPAKMCVTYDF